MKKFTFLLFAGLCALIMSCVSTNSITVGMAPSPATTVSSTTEVDLCAAVANLRAATTTAEIEAVTTVLEAIRKQDPGNWLTHYHTAYAYGRIAHLVENLKEVDDWVEKAEAALADAAKSEGFDASEIHVVESYLMYASIRVSPMMRGYKFSKKAIKKLALAVKANGNNPRAYLLLAQHMLNVPAMLGGDPEKACKYNDAAQKVYSAEAADEDHAPLNPSWGRPDSDEIHKSFCSEESDSKRK